MPSAIVWNGGANKIRRNRHRNVDGAITSPGSNLRPNAKAERINTQAKGGRLIDDAIMGASRHSGEGHLIGGCCAVRGGDGRAVDNRGRLPGAEDGIPISAREIRRAFDVVGDVELSATGS